MRAFGFSCGLLLVACLCTHIIMITSTTIEPNSKSSGGLLMRGSCSPTIGRRAAFVLRGLLSTWLKSALSKRWTPAGSDDS